MRVSGHHTRHELPGVSRVRTRFHWELLVCGLSGHALVGVESAHLDGADPALAREIDGVRWHRCLRCDSWVPVAAPAAPNREDMPLREEIELPIRGRPLRDKIILRLIAVDRMLHFIVLAVASVAVFFIASDREVLRDRFYAVLDALNGTLGGTTNSHGAFIDRIDDILNFSPEKLHLIGAVLAVYALVEGAEAVGLWMQKRWAEYLTFIATTALLPLEIYELAHGIKPLKVIALVVNLAVVVYLLRAKRLFGVRGGAAAEEERRARDYGWQAIDRTSPEAFGGS